MAIPTYLNFNIKKWIEKMLPSNKRKTFIIAWLKSLCYPLLWSFSNWRNEYLAGANYDSWSDLTAYIEGDKVVYKQGIYECIADIQGKRPTNRKYWILISESFIGLYDRLNYTAQKMSMEAYLNKFFMSSGIYISHNSIKTENPTFYNVAEQKPIYFANENESVPFVLGDSYVKGDLVEDSNVLYWCEQDNANEPLYKKDFWSEYQAYFTTEEYYYSEEDYTVFVPLALFNSLGTTDENREGIIRGQVNKYNYFGINYNVITY